MQGTTRESTTCRAVGGYTSRSTSQEYRRTSSRLCARQEAEECGYELLITTDQQLRNQQNLADRQLAMLVLLSTSWPRIRLRIDEIEEVVNGMQPGEYRETLV